MRTPTYGPFNRSSSLPPYGVCTTYSPLHRPWSAPLPTVGRAGRVRRAWGTRALVAGALLVGLTVGASAGSLSAEAAPREAGSPGCSFSIGDTNRELVVETDVPGRIEVWHGSDPRPRFSFVAPANDIEFFNLKRRHRDVSHFQVAVVALNRAHNDEQVTWCKPV